MSTHNIHFHGEIMDTGQGASNVYPQYLKNNHLDTSYLELYSLLRIFTADILNFAKYVLQAV